MYSNTEEAKSILLVRAIFLFCYPSNVRHRFSVPHDRLFLDALERDLKREKMGLEPTTQIVGEPALSFTYDPKKTLYEQFSKAQGAREGEGELEMVARRASEDGETTGYAGAGFGGAAAPGGGGYPPGMGMDTGAEGNGDINMGYDSEGILSEDVDDTMTGGASEDDSAAAARRKRPATGPNGNQFLQLFSLFEGSPTYKQRRKKGFKPAGASASGAGPASSALRRSSMIII
jgi:transcription factor STE12